MRSVNFILKQIVFISSFVFLLTSCAKKSDVSPSDQNKVNLTGVSSLPTKWNLTTLTSSGTVQTLSYSQKRYSKTFGKNGAYSDTDGFVGTWELSASDQLVERYVYFPSGTPSPQTFQIVSSTATNLILSYTSNGTPITAVYTAGN
jgi:hypothetical protein